jgi:hypothetical protein
MFPEQIATRSIEVDGEEHTPMAMQTFADLR